jgi:hypothetical protein
MSMRPSFGLMMAAVAAMAGARFQEGARTLRSMGLAADADGVISSRNGGRRTGNRHVQRAALKRRNQARHRKACR